MNRIFERFWFGLTLALLALIVLFSRPADAQLIDYNQSVKNKPSIATISPLTVSGTNNPLVGTVTLGLGTVPVNKGGTGQTAYTDGQVLIGDSSSGGLDKSTLIAGANITITNGHGTVTITASNGASITLKTNGTANGSQTLLNLVAGLGITLADDGTGDITITGTCPWCGDGSDGALVYDGSTTILGMAPVANVYTLTRDIFGTNCTVNNGVTVITNNFAVYCKGTLTNNGTIHNNGTLQNNGGNAVSSAGAAGGGTVNGAGNGVGHYPRLQTSVAGTAGGAGQTGAGSQAPAANSGNVANPAVDGSGVTGSTGASGGLGGTGTSGAGGAVRAGGSGGIVSSVAAQIGHSSTLAQFGGFLNVTTTTWKTYLPPNGGNGGAPGGGGGGGDGTNAGGGGGGGGSEGQGAGMMGLFANSIVNSGTISCNGATGGKGGNGFSPTAGNTGAGAGGAGGSGGMGGLCWEVAHSITNSGTFQAVGGSGGLGGTAGLPHGTGTNNATNGSQGPTGPNGLALAIVN